MADNFPLSTWDGVNSPWMNIQNWRVYGHGGSGTSNTGFRNYGATGVNSSSGVGTRQVGFREGMPVQRTQYRAPNAGVQQRFTGDTIRPNTPPSMAPAIQGFIKTGKKLFSDPEMVAQMPQDGWRGKVTRGMNTFFTGPTPKVAKEEAVEPERVVTNDPIVLARQQRAREGREAREAGTFQPEVRPLIPMTKPSFTPDIPQYTREQRQQMRTEQRQRLGQPPIQPPTPPEPFVPTSLQQRAIEGAAANKALREKSPAAETPSTSRLSKRPQQRARADAAFASLRTGQAMESTRAAGILDRRTW